MLADDLLEDAELLWDYNQMHHPVRQCDAAIVLGSHDLGVAGVAAEMYLHGNFPVAVFTGGRTPSAAAIFPRGEAVHFREHALSLGVPEEVALLEPDATNTGENITLSWQVLERVGYEVESVLLISKPYMERRAYATCRKLWPQVDTVCASARISLTDYLASSGDAAHTISMIVGDTQRVFEYPHLGYAIPQEVPKKVHMAFDRLVMAGFTERLLSRSRAPSRTGGDTVP